MEATPVHSYNTKLKDRILWYDGDSTVSEKELLRRLESGKDISGLCVDSLSDSLRQYNRLVPSESQIKVKTSIRPLRTDWVLPEQYAKLNVVAYVIEKLYDISVKEGWSDEKVEESLERVKTEIDLYKKHGLFDLLRALIFIINTLHSLNIVWGVGRGSSVSSYVLYLIGVHDVDSLEYGLDIEDFIHG